MAGHRLFILIGLLSAWLIAPGAVWAGECAFPITGFSHSARDVQINRIVINLNSPFSRDDIQGLEDAFDNCNSQVTTRIQELTTQLSQLWEWKANLQGSSDVQAYLQAVQTLKTAQQEIKDSLAGDLAQLNFDGLYGVVVEGGPGLLRDQLKERAIAALTPVAISDLRGVSIESATEIQDARVIFDQIVSRTSGELRISRIIEEPMKFFRGRPLLFFVAKVRVQPLAGEVGSGGAAARGASAHEGINLLAEGGLDRYQAQVAEVSGSPEYAAELRQQIERRLGALRQAIDVTNQGSQQSEARSLNRFSEELRDTETEIQESMDKVAGAREELRAIYQRLQLPACEPEPESCMPRAIAGLDARIQNLLEQSRVEESRRWHHRAGGVIQAEGDYTGEMRTQARDIYRNLAESYGGAQQFLQEVVVSQGRLESDSQESAYVIERTPREVRLFPFVSSRGDLRLMVAVNFHVEHGAGPQASAPPPSTPSPPRTPPQPPPPSVVEPPRPPASTPPSTGPSLSAAEIRSLLRECAAHVEANRLTLPVDNNAVGCFQRVLAADSDNRVARRGIWRVESRYRELAQKALQQGNRDKVAAYAARIREFSPDSAIAREIEGWLGGGGSPGPSSPTPSVGGPWRERVTGMVFQPVPQGCFQMGNDSGDNNERPIHRVCLDAFLMGKFEVTQEQWLRIMGDNPSRFHNNDDHPVENVSWEDVQRFINRLNRRSSERFRLPTEAEWEYACRSGGRDEKYAGGFQVTNLAWFEDNARGRTHPVGQKQPNGLGIYDMSGNVAEWIQDSYSPRAYRRHARSNPVNDQGRSLRVTRGGAWDSGLFYDLRCTRRQSNDAGQSSRSLGFRLVRNP